MKSFFSEFWGFLKTRKRYWLAPAILTVLLLAVLILLGQGKALAPYVYTLF